MGAANRPSGGGGGRPNVGAGNRPGGGGGGVARPSPGGGGNRPGMGSGGRPNVGGGNRPGAGSPGFANRPGAGNGNRPGAGGGNLPGIGNGNRPGIGDGNRPGIGNGNRPGIGDGNRPGIGNGNRPGIGDGNRPGIGNGNRPGIGDGNRPGIGDGNRPDWANNGNRPNWAGNGNNFNNINFNNQRNFAVANGNNWNNDWHHGYWGGGAWGGAAAGWGLGYGAGYRNGYWNGYNDRPWYSSAALWGMGGWALGSIYYGSGYGSYSNPYYASSSAYYDYSQPIQVINQPVAVAAEDPTATGTAAVEPPPEVQASRTHLDAARDAFLAGDYNKAGSEIELAIKERPTDAALHEFRGLVYFAQGDYSKAAGTLYAVLSAGPGWDWTTMSSLYPSVDTYTTQLRALEAFVKENPNSADARFVLAYQYITATHKDAALRQLQEVVRLQPSDQLSAQLIQSMGGQAPAQPGAPPAASSDTAVAGTDQPQPPDIDPTKIVGRRTAKREDGTTFTLDLTPDDKFTWTFEKGGKKQEFGGTYSVDGAVLVLERSDKSTMPGLVTMEDKGFNFKLFGAPDSDPGLDFKS